MTILKDARARQDRAVQLGGGFLTRGGEGMFKRIAVLVVLALGLSIGAPAARADVIINVPPSVICDTVGINVGVYYQWWSGGSPKFKIRIKRLPSFHVVWSKQGLAKRHYQEWTYYPVINKGSSVKFRVVYVADGIRTWYPVRVRWCAI